MRGLRGRPTFVQRFIFVAIACAGLAFSGAARAKGEKSPPVPLPYFASLKRPITNVRVGPGVEYPIRWVYRKRGIPVEVTARFGNWRRIRASDGAEGWISNVLLSSTRTAMIAPWGERNVDLRSRASVKSGVLARMQPGVLVRLRACDRTWCSVSLPGRDDAGYVSQVKLWGVYPDEEIEDRSMWGRMRGIL